MRSLPVLRIRYAVITDIISIALAFAASFAIRYEPAGDAFPALVQSLPLLWLSLAVRMPVYVLFGLYHRLWRYASTRELVSIIAAGSVSSLVICAANYALMPALGLPSCPSRSILVLDWLLNLAFLSGTRLALRMSQERVDIRQRHLVNVFVPNKQRALIAGAGDAGAMLAREMWQNPNLGVFPIGFVDENPAKVSMRIHDVRVLGTYADIPVVAKRHMVDEVLIAATTAAPATIQEIKRLCREADVPYRLVPGIHELLEGRITGKHLQDLHRNVLVIGGAGYIGSALLPKLLDRGYRVRLLDMLLYGTDPIRKLLDHPRLEVVQADFRSVDKVVEAMADVDAVIHLGAIVGDPACALDEHLTVEINLTATRMIAEVAKGSGVSRMVFASTCSVYGASDDLLDERSALNPVSLYARSKIASERVLLQMTDERFTPVILRFGTIYGLSGRTRFDLVVNLLTAKAMVDKQITVMGGDQWRPFVHVDDAALAVLKALEAPAAVAGGETFNVGSDEQNYTIGQVGEIIHRMVPTAELLDLGSDGDRRNYRVSFAKIRKALCFAPQWRLEQGIQQVVDAIATGAVTDYRDSRYSNVKFLKEEGALRLTREVNWAHVMINETAEPEPMVAR